MVQAFVEFIVSFVRENHAWAAPMAFLIAFMESFAFLSIVWPGTAMLIGVSALLAASGMEIERLWPAILAAGLGGTLGYALSYWIGRYFKDSLQTIWPFNRHPETLVRGKEFFDKYGAMSVFFGHFFGPVRAVIPVVAGMYSMRQLPFQMANILSAFIWAAGVIAPGFFLVAFKQPIFDFISAHQYLAATGMFLLALLHSMPIAILYWPSLALLFGGSLLFLFAGGDLPLLFVAGVLGTLLGDLYAYWTGEDHRNDPSQAWLSGWYKDDVPAVRSFLGKWGAIGVVVSKFMGLRRAHIPIVAGLDGMSELKFVPASIVSALILTSVIVAPYWLMQYFAVQPALP